MGRNGSSFAPLRRLVSRTDERLPVNHSSPGSGRRGAALLLTFAWILFTLGIAAAIFAWAAFSGTICGSSEGLRTASLWVLVADGVAMTGPVGLWLIKRTRVWKIVSIVSAFLCLLLFLSYFVPSFSAPTQAQIQQGEAQCV